jgi:acyl carrier protein
MNADQNSIFDTIRQQIEPLALRAGIEPKTININTDLFALGVLDSFDVVTVLVALEENLGFAPVFLDDSDDDFTMSIKWIAEGFLRGSNSSQ